MPVYGKGRTNRKKGGRVRNKKGSLYSTIEAGFKGGQKIERIGKRRQLGYMEYWDFEDSPIWNTRWGPQRGVEERTGPVREKIKERMRKVKQPVVVDWGCGNGTAITQIAEEFPQAKCYGYSRGFYPNWRKNEKVKFIHAPSGELARYFGNNSIDVLYSNLGLFYLTAKGQWVELNKLVKKVKVGGFVLVDSLELATVNKLKKCENLKISVDRTNWEARKCRKVLIERTE